MGYSAERKKWPKWPTCALVVGMISMSFVADLQAEEVEGKSSQIERETHSTESENGVAPDKDCLPSCRPGYLCLEGRCVSPCNPPCPGGEVCSRNGKCIPAVPYATTALPARSATPGYGYASQPSRTSLGSSTEMFDQDKYNKFEKIKKDGDLLVGVGLLLALGSVPLYVVSAVNENKDDDIALVCNLGAAALDIIGTTMLIVGIVKTVTGNKGMQKAKTGQIW